MLVPKPDIHWKTMRFECPHTDCGRGYVLADHARRDAATVDVITCPEHRVKVRLVEERPLVDAEALGELVEAASELRRVAASVGIKIGLRRLDAALASMPGRPPDA